MSGRPRQSHTPAYDESFLRENDFLPQQHPATASADVGGAVALPTPDVAAQLVRTMKRAFHDAMIESVSTGRGDLGQLKSVMLELHQKLRNLVPHRTDLHGTLSDDDVRGMALHGGGAGTNCTSDGGEADDAEEGGDQSQVGGGTNAAGSATAAAQEGGADDLIEVVAPRLIRAADALQQLESEDRAVTTRAWADVAGQVLASCSHPSDDAAASTTKTKTTIPYGLTSAAFVISSVAFLHAKADLCGSDVADFHLSHNLAPRIAAAGVEYERSAFQERFGPFDGDVGGNAGNATAPVTREWIRRTVDGCGVPRDELRSSEESRVLALQAYGWVDSILFQAAGSGGVGDGAGGDNEEAGATAAATERQLIRVPEVLHNDVGNLRQIRDVTRMSVVGSALALHACTVAGVGDAVLRTDPPSADVDRCRRRLVSAMSDRGGGSQERYERGVSDAVVELARVFKPTLDAADADVLASRTSSVLRGEDPVIKLLDDRMRIVFREMMSWEPAESEKIPLSMKTGRSLSVRRGTTSSGAATTYATLFEAAARRQFASRGFAFYACSELAKAAKTATKVINLVIVLFGEIFLDPLFLHALEESSQ